MTHTEQQAWADRVRTALEGQGRRPVIDYLQRQRWFGGKGKTLVDVSVFDAIELATGAKPCFLGVLRVEYRGGDQERYMVPLSVRPRSAPEESAAIAELLGSSGHQWVCDATREDDVWRSFCAIVAGEKEVAGQSVSVSGRTMSGRQEELAGAGKVVRLLSAEQTNTSVMIDRRVILKLIRKVETGINPESELLEFLTTKTTCRDVPPLLGIMTYEENQGDEVAEGTIGVLQRFVPNQGDGWSYTLVRLGELLEQTRRMRLEPGDNLSKTVHVICDDFFGEIRQLGVITGNLHLALASNTTLEAFCAEPISSHDVERWQRKMTQCLTEACRDLQALSADQQSALGLSRDEADGLEAACRERFGDLMILVNGRAAKIRHHGDYHLGQVLKTDSGFVVIDFEGEPARPLEERRAKLSPLKDVAGMLRSFNYAGQAVLKQRPPVSATDSAVMREWESAARAAFLDGYQSVAGHGEAVFLPAAWDDTLRVLQVYELEKAVYELQYELRSRPEWLSIPLQGIRSLVRERAA